jgi:hypothetical protein
MEKDIGKINKNDTTDIVVRVDDFGGRKGLTIREFVTSDRYTGFTKSGVRILSKDFQNFKQMINSVTDEDMKEVEQSDTSGDAGAPQGSSQNSAPSESNQSPSSDSVDTQKIQDY